MKKINYPQIRRNIIDLNKNHQLILVVKDCAYGFDMVRVVKEGIEAGVHFFAVKTIKEAIFLRKNYEGIRILLLGIPPKNLELLLSHHLDITIENSQDFAYFMDKGIPYFLKFNLGMNRFGFNCNEIEFMKNQLTYCAGSYIHVPTKRKRENTKIKEKFERIIKYLELENKINHLGGSHMLQFKDDRFYYRIGEEIYYNSIYFFSKVIKIRRVLKGEYVGYERGYRASKNCLVAILDVGYADGLERRNKKEKFLIKNAEYSVIGYKGMDHTYLLVDEKVQEGDLAYLIKSEEDFEILCKKYGITKHEGYLKLH